MRFIYLAAFVVFTVFCVIVAVSNRAVVAFSLDPLPVILDMPLYLVFFTGIFIGLGAGAMVVMTKTIRQARHNSRQARKTRDLEKRLKDLAANGGNDTPQE